MNDQNKYRIAVVAHEASKTVEQELIPAAVKRGHVCDRVDLAFATLSSFYEDPAISALFEYDVVYYRTGLGAFGPFVLAPLLNAQGVQMVNDAYRYHPFITQKFYQPVAVSQLGVALPRTVAMHPPVYTKLAEALGTPFIAKENVSSQGKAVHKISSEADLIALVESTDPTEVLYQEFIAHDCDYRVHLVGREPVATYRRFPADGDFRTNVSRGGRMASVADDEKEIVYALARKVNEVFRLDIGAIDFIRSKDNDGYYFTEINCNPGWEASDTDATNVDMTALVIDYLEQRAAQAQRQK